MPRQGRIKTKYPGVYYVVKNNEKIFYIVYYLNGKKIEEKAGRQFSNDMTPAKASAMRDRRAKGIELSNSAQREQDRAAKIAAARKMTLTRLWEKYKASKTDFKSINADESRFKKHLEPDFGDKEPHTLIRLDIDRLRVKLSRKLEPKTVKNILELLQRVVNFGVSRQLCDNLNFKIDTIKVDNIKTEDLSPKQLKNLLAAIDKSTDIEAANIMRLALYTGMRRGEMFKLKWTDVDFERGFISIRNPKGGVSQKIPLNEQARAVLENHPKTKISKDQEEPKYSEYVFVNTQGNPFTDIRARVNAIKEAAELPADFRALHGLRHTYASMLASSGKVDLYTLQKLLTHKSPVMTQRYAHLRDEAMKKASELAGKIIEQAMDSNVVELSKKEQVEN
ncbi:MAG TPA: site-specific integrase [Smithellaceae bacterium]|jgi:integrase|nr:site-specific integrase [Smithellaceae bacterium]HQF84240.1 site-specific integrase [Smithellaceae bacterium]HQG80593.1 site-specific integrase [Smithellaceae bacterium]